MGERIGRIDTDFGVPMLDFQAKNQKKPLLDHVIEKATVQLADYMQLARFQRPNLLGFCLVYVGSECKKILPYV